ncbi:MAG: ATP-binding protein [Acidobacteriota bacterium]|nr:ATP-binding protein [Acidobacteriota bacterium]
MARFQARARTVDMLGRQQIAGIPTAISELFKNAHDAYADHVEVDYFRSDRLFILRDDGLGMTRDDFENRWLTLGTESKIGGAGLEMPPVDEKKKKRPIMGEKGIGRLAIALIGPQVLVLTRAERNGELMELVAAYIHWGLFECPGINLSDIEIPVKTFPGNTLPDARDIEAMVNEVRENLESLVDRIDENQYDRLSGDLDRFNVDPLDLDAFFKDLSLKNGRGTHFFILPASEDLQVELEVDGGGKEISDLKKLLVGFTNTMLPDQRPAIETAFRYWPTDDAPLDIIGSAEFFTPEEFELADHHIKGRFDEYGQFQGTVTVYDEEPVHHTVPWRGSLGRPVSCGSFELDFAYVMGRESESKLPKGDFVKVGRKLDKISGLYIYRDGIRILPYGDSDFDWLEMEKRRTKSAGYYFFSYRRLFGSIRLSNQANKSLVEKAGREGFQKNAAYREFRSILMHFFVQIVADFFREGGTLAETFRDRLEEFQVAHKAKEKREKGSREKRRRLKTDLETFFGRLDNDEPQRKVEALESEVDAKIGKAIANKMPGQGAEDLLQAEVGFNKDLDKLSKRYAIQLPRGVALTKALKRDWEAYRTEKKLLDETLFSSERRRLSRKIAEAAEQNGLQLDQRKRSAQLLNQATRDMSSSVSREAKGTNETVKQTSSRITRLTRSIIGEITEVINRVEAQFHGTKLSAMTQDEVDELRLKLEAQVEEKAENGRLLLEHIRAQIQNIQWFRDEDGLLIGDAEINASLEEEVLALRERADMDLEMSQLGMAIEIINHEFDSLIRVIRENIMRLKSWADINPDIVSLYQDLRTTFDHLDGYLTLFTPLHRRLYRKAIEIEGSDIAKYLHDLFKVRLNRHDVSLKVTDAFAKKKIIGFPSTYYPVFVNLVDNSIFWLKERSQPRIIVLDAKAKAFIVSDTGPGISARSKPHIFEPGFSTKPGGRGLGLAISREVLAKENYDLVLDDNKSSGATFRIVPKE